MTIQLSDHFNYSRLFRFTMPSIIMMIVTSVYSVVDGLFVSNFVGDMALAAVNVIYPLTMIVGAFGFMLGTGGSAEVARVMGAGEKERAKEYFSTLIYTILTLGIVLSALCIIFIHPLAGFLGATEELLHDCIVYGVIMLAGSPIFMLQTSFQAFCVVAERPKMGLWLSVGAGLTNMILDYVFIAVLRWGIAGAAIATVCGYLVAGLIPLVFFALPNKTPLRLGKTHLHPKMLLKSCGNGSSELMSNICASVVTILYNRSLMNLAGKQGVAAYSVMMYVGFIFAAVHLGFSMGVAPVFSYQFGANNTDELHSLYQKALRIVLILCGVMTVAAFALAPFLSRIFVGYDQALYELTVHGFRLFALSFLCSGLNIFGSSFFTALGDGLVSAIISFLRALVFQVIAILLLPLLLDLDGVWLATVVAEVLAAAVTIWFLKTKKSKYHYA